MSRPAFEASAAYRRAPRVGVCGTTGTPVPPDVLSLSSVDDDELTQRWGTQRGRYVCEVVFAVGIGARRFARPPCAVRPKTSRRRVYESPPIDPRTRPARTEPSPGLVPTKKNAGNCPLRKSGLAQLDANFGAAARHLWGIAAPVLQAKWPKRIRVTGPRQKTALQKPMQHQNAVAAMQQQS